MEQPTIKKENVEKIKAEYTQHVNIQNTSKYLKINAGTIESYTGIHLRDLEFPDKVEEVGYNAFEDAKIGKVVFNEKCKKISSSAFKNSTISERKSKFGELK